MDDAQMCVPLEEHTVALLRSFNDRSGIIRQVGLDDERRQRLGRLRHLETTAVYGVRKGPIHRQLDRNIPIGCATCA